MLIKITEINMWERERWSYILDMINMDADILNMLVIFIRCANAQFEIDKTNAAKNGHGQLFASSKYFIEFYDSYEISKSGYVALISKTHKLFCGSEGGYKSGGLFLKEKISFRRLKSAVIAIRDKGENKLYKNFEILFLRGNHA